MRPQVPYETLNKRFRAAQKNIDRETSHVTMAVAELEKTLSSFPVMDSVVSLLDGVVEKLSALKRKVSWKQNTKHEFDLHKDHAASYFIQPAFKVISCRSVLLVICVGASLQECSLWVGPCFLWMCCGYVLPTIFSVGRTLQDTSSLGCSLWTRPCSCVLWGHVLSGAVHVDTSLQERSMRTHPH